MSIYIRNLKARVTRRRSLVTDNQKRFQLSSELAETVTVRWLQWSRQLVPKPRSGDIKRPVTQSSSGPRYDACAINISFWTMPVNGDIFYKPNNLP